MFGGEDAVTRLVGVNANETPKQKYAKLAQFVDMTIAGTKIDAAKGVIQRAQLDNDALKQKVIQAEIDKKGLAQAMDLLMPKTVESPAGKAVREGGFDADLSGLSTAQTTTAPKFDRNTAMHFLGSATKAGVSPEALDRIDQYFKMAMPASGQKPIKIDKFDTTIDGKEMTVAINADTGEQVGMVNRAQGPVLSANDQLKLEEEKLLLGDANTRVKNYLQLGDDAGASRAQLSVIRNTLKDPDLYAGPGADIVALGKRMASGLGMDIKGLDSYEKLNSVIGGQVLERIKVLRPASDTDIKILQNYFNSTTKTKEGNEAVADVLDRAEEYKQERADYIRELKDEGKRVTEIDRLVSKWEKKNPLILIKDSDKEKLSNPQPQKVLMMKPDGTQVMVPSVNLSKALDRGWKKL